MKVETQLIRSIEVLMSDRDIEDFSIKFDAYCEEYDIIHEFSVPRTP